MSAFAKPWLSFILCASLPLAGLRAEESSKPKNNPAAPKQEATEGGADSEADDMAKMNSMMIKGQDIKGMRYAHADENGKVVMEFESEIARKIDDEHIEWENLKIIAFDDDGKQINIDLPFSVLNLVTRILDSKSQVTIKREDFEIIGETGEFNTKTRFAKLLGNVKMIILNTENLDK